MGLGFMGEKVSLQRYLMFRPGTGTKNRMTATAFASGLFAPLQTRKASGARRPVARR